MMNERKNLDQPSEPESPQPDDYWWQYHDVQGLLQVSDRHWTDFEEARSAAHLAAFDTGHDVEVMGYYFVSDETDIIETIDWESTVDWDESDYDNYVYLERE